MSWESFVLEMTGKLREARIDQGISLEGLAEETEIKLQALKQMEGGNGSITLDKLLLIADFLDVNLCDKMDDFWTKHAVDPPRPES